MFFPEFRSLAIALSNLRMGGHVPICSSFLDPDFLGLGARISTNWAPYGELQILLKTGDNRKDDQRRSSG